MSLGLFVLMTNGFAIYLYYVTAGKDDVNLFYAATIPFAAIGLLYILGLISFGQVIAKSSDGRIVTYYTLGKQKWKYRALGRLKHAQLEQDSDRYYCLKIETVDGNAFILEKHPTLNEANERLEELRSRLM